MHVGFDKIFPRFQSHIPERGNFMFAVVISCILGVFFRGLQVPAEPLIYPILAVGIPFYRLAVKRQFRILGDTEIIVRKIGKHRWFSVL